MVYSNVWRKLIDYIFMRGCFVPLLVLASFLFKVAAALFLDVWLALMSLEYFGLSENTYFFVFLGASIFMIFFGYFRDVWFFSEMQKNSNILHKKLMEKVFLMKVDWAEVFPEASISYKATMDTMVLDSKLS